MFTEEFGGDVFTVGAPRAARPALEREIVPLKTQSRLQSAWSAIVTAASKFGEAQCGLPDHSQGRIAKPASGKKFE